MRGKLFLLSFTQAGAELGKKICDNLSNEWDCFGWAVERHSAKSGLLPLKEPLSAWTEAAFAEAGAVVFVSACGIAVRAIAPFLRDKSKDPAVIVVDEGGHHSISLLSGHLGGANLIAKKIAKITGAEPVITTATDINNRFAVDLWAQANNLHLEDRKIAKEITATILDGEEVEFHTDFPIRGEIPLGLCRGNIRPYRISVAYQNYDIKNEHELRLTPKGIVLGIGCRRGIREKIVEDFVLQTFSANKIPIEAVCGIASIDLKRDEAGLLGFCKKFGWELKTFSAVELNRVKGAFSHSDFVTKVTGTDNVCERAAALSSGGEVFLQKQSANGVTLAAAGKPVVLDFNLFSPSRAAERAE